LQLPVLLTISQSSKNHTHKITVTLAVWPAAVFIGR